MYTKEKQQKITSDILLSIFTKLLNELTTHTIKLNSLLDTFITEQRGVEWKYLY